MIVVFDVDGTLVDSGGSDNECFDEAFREATGAAIRTEQWMAMHEVTAKAIVHQMFPDDSPGELARKEQAVEAGYLDRLKLVYRRNPTVFRPLPGALAQFAQLCQMPGCSVAIATGDWHTTITLKLKAAGFDLDGVPLATASERYRRADIIRLAVERAGRQIRDAIYLGDGLWDLRATRDLNIPFVGIGARQERLQAAGAIHTLPDYEDGRLPAILAALADRRRDT
jgi:phosphoglycolate phosphatase-like HAD superfamily hydrolase